jgi:dihydrofolate reductase
VTPARVTLVVARAENGVIGHAGGLPWRLPEDLRRFKAATLGKAVVMGRKTFESIGRALPGRLNIVLTRSTWFRPADPEVRVVNDWFGARAAAGEVPEIMVIGGAEIYALVMPEAQRVLLTEVHGAPAGDAFLPAFDMDVWQEQSREQYVADERNAFDMSFVALQRR